MILFVFGAGGGAIELLESLYDYDLDKSYFDNVILVEDKPKSNILLIPYSQKGKLFPRKFDVISMNDFDAISYKRDDWYFISASDPKYKKRIAEKYPELKFISVVHKTADCLLTDKGRGNWFAQNSHVGADSHVGDFVRLNYNAAVGHSSRIGNYSFIGINTSVCATTTIGEGVYVGSNVVIINKNLKIGDYAVIGAGSVVTKDVKAGEVVFGVPAKKPQKAGAKK